MDKRYLIEKSTFTLRYNNDIHKQVKLQAIKSRKTVTYIIVSAKNE